MSNFRGLSSKFRDKEEFYFFDKFVPINPGFPSPSPSVSVTPTPSISITPTPSITQSITPTPSITQSITPTPTITPSSSSIPVTPSVTPTVTPSISVTPTVTPSISVSPTVTPSVTLSPTPTPSATPIGNNEYAYVIDTTIQTSGGVSGTTSNTDQYLSPLVITDGTNYVIDWGDGSSSTIANGVSNTHTYSSSGQYTIRIQPENPGEKITRILHFATTGDSSKVLEIVSWGNNVCDYTNWEGHLRKCHSLTTLPSSSQPTFPVGASMERWFSTMTAFNYDISGWNVSNVTNMRRTFESIQNVVSAFNQPIGSWDVSNVTNMDEMFEGDGLFNQNIGGWNVGNVTSMEFMFYNNNTFNNGGSSDINNWNVSNVTSMRGMFQNNTGFNQPIDKWNVSSVTDFSSMFAGTTLFNQNIGGWNVSNGLSMTSMFDSSTSFNNGGSPSINNWVVTGGTGSHLTTIFQDATAFNQPVGNWDVSNMVNLLNIFDGATSFNQSLANWDIRGITTSIPGSMNGMLDNCGMSTANYDATLIAWAGLSPTPATNLVLGANGLTYTLGGAAETARDFLTINLGWTINGDTGV